LPFYFVGINLM